MSSEGTGAVALPVTALEYFEIGRKPREAECLPLAVLRGGPPSSKRIAEFESSAQELAARLERERAEAASEAERRVRASYDGELGKLRDAVGKALADFEVQRHEYFGRVEAEVVQLALSIAAKILHREAQVDPMLVAALTRLTMEKMREGSVITVRVATGRATVWQEYLGRYPKLATVQIVEDADLSEADCALETDLGTTHLGLDRQLKEVEQGFFDLLALRPERS